MLTENQKAFLKIVGSSLVLLAGALILLTHPATGINQTNVSNMFKEPFMTLDTSDAILTFNGTPQPITGHLSTYTMIYGQDIILQLLLLIVLLLAGIFLNLFWMNIFNFCRWWFHD